MCGCKGKGFVRIKYQSGAPDDLALCVCPAARVYRRWYQRHPDILAKRLGLEPSRLWLVEDLCDVRELAAARLFPEPIDDYREPRKPKPFR